MQENASNLHTHIVGMLHTFNMYQALWSSNLMCVCGPHQLPKEPSGMDYNFLNTIHYVPPSAKGSQS